MTEIVYRNTSLYQEMQLSGHAGDRTVCAGISAISQTLIANLLKEESRNDLRLQWTMNEPGEIWMRAWTTKKNREAIRAMFAFTAEGLRKMAEDYPGNLELKEENGNGNV